MLTRSVKGTDKPTSMSVRQVMLMCRVQHPLKTLVTLSVATNRAAGASDIGRHQGLQTASKGKQTVRLKVKLKKSLTTGVKTEQPLRDRLFFHDSSPASGCAPLQLASICVMSGMLQSHAVEHS